MENQMVCIIPFGMFCKLCATSWGDTLFVILLFLVDFGMFLTFSFFCKAILGHEMFTLENSNQMVYVNGKYPSSTCYKPFFLLPEGASDLQLYQTSEFTCSFLSQYTKLVNIIDS